MKAFLARIWKYLALTAGGIVLLAVTYFAGSSRRKGEVDIKMAERELDAVNKQHEAATKQVDTLHQRQIRLVSDILAEQMRRADAAKNTQGLSDAEIDKRLRDRGLLADDTDGKPK